MWADLFGSQLLKPLRHGDSCREYPAASDSQISAITRCVEPIDILPMKPNALLITACLSLASGFWLGQLSTPLAAHPPDVAVTGTSNVPPSGKRPALQQRPVLRVVDGDTLEMLYRPPQAVKEKVRLLFVNTPERGQPGYQQAADALRKITANRKVHLAFDSLDNMPQRDRYGRLLAYVIADGTNVNLEIIRQGWSTYWTKFGRSQIEPAFRQAQREAQESRRGLWSLDRKPIDQK